MSRPRMLPAMLMACALSATTFAQVTITGSQAAGTQRAIAARQVRVPAEWEPHEATWMQWPKGVEASYRPNFAEIIRVIQFYEPVRLVVNGPGGENNARNFLQSSGVPLTNITFHQLPYNWAWMRDNGPVWVRRPSGLEVQDWGFDGWGGQESPWSSDDAIPGVVANVEGVPAETFSLINERGSLEFNGSDTLIASWPVQQQRNPGVSKAQQEAQFKAAFGVDKVIWLPQAVGTDFTGGHVDGIARFIDRETVVVSRYANQNDPDAAVYEAAAAECAAAGLNVLRLNIPGKVSYFGLQMECNYINWLVGNDFVLVGGFNRPAWDAAARATVQSYFPGRWVEVVDIREIWSWGGGVHCVTNDQPLVR